MMDRLDLYNVLWAGLIWKVACEGVRTRTILEASGIPAPTLYRFINRERSITLETAGKLAKALGLSLVQDPVRVENPAQTRSSEGTSETPE